MPTPDEIHEEKEKRRKLDAELKIKQNVENVRMRQESESRGTTAKDFREMKKRNEAPKTSAPSQPTGLQKTMGWVQERGRAINETSRADRASSGPLMRPVSNPFQGSDLFGVGNMGSPFTATPAVRAYAPRRSPAPVKRKPKKRRAPAPREEQPSGMHDPFGLGGFKRLF